MSKSWLRDIMQLVTEHRKNMSDMEQRLIYIQGIAQNGDLNALQDIIESLWKLTL